MVVFVDLEHGRLERAQPDYFALVQRKRERTRSDLQTITGKPCCLLRFTRLMAAPRVLRRASLIVLSGHNTGFEHYSAQELAPVQALLQEPPCPVFTICGSFQLMTKVHGGEIGPIGARTSDAVVGDPDPVLPGSMLQENGFSRIAKRASSVAPFHQLPPESWMLQHHFWEVKTLPEAFVGCATSELCAHQAVVHRSLPLAGVQFHPEEYDAEHPEGRRLLEAVWRWAQSA